VLSLVALCNHLGWPPYDPATQTRLETLSTGNHAGFDRWLAEASAALAQAVLTLEMLFDPECVIVGGLLPRAVLERLIDATSLQPSVALRRDRPRPRMVAGAGDPWTAAIGAAAGPIASAFDPDFRFLQKV